MLSLNTRGRFCFLQKPKKWHTLSREIAYKCKRNFISYFNDLTDSYEKCKNWIKGKYFSKTCFHLLLFYPSQKQGIHRVTLLPVASLIECLFVKRFYTPEISLECLSEMQITTQQSTNSYPTHPAAHKNVMHNRLFFVWILFVKEQAFP